MRVRVSLLGAGAGNLIRIDDLVVQFLLQQHLAGMDRSVRRWPCVSVLAAAISRQGPGKILRSGQRLRLRCIGAGIECGVARQHPDQFRSMCRARRSELRRSRLHEPAPRHSTKPLASAVTTGSQAGGRPSGNAPELTVR